MSDGETKRYEKADRQLSMPVAAVVALVGSLVSGGVSAKVTGGSAEAGMVRMEAKIEALQDSVTRQGESVRDVVLRLDARDVALDERLRAVELHQARGQPR